MHPPLPRTFRAGEGKQDRISSNVVARERAIVADDLGENGSPPPHLLFARSPIFFFFDLFPHVRGTAENDLRKLFTPTESSLGNRLYAASDRHVVEKRTPLEYADVAHFLHLAK